MVLEPFRKGVGSNPAAVISKILVGPQRLDSKPEHFPEPAFLVLDVFLESTSDSKHERSGAVVSVLGS